MGSPVLASSNSGVGPGSTSQTLPALAGVAAGDLLLAAVNIHSTSTTVATFPGWTPTAEILGTLFRTVVYRRVATGADAYAFTLSAGTSVAMISARITGADAVSPVDASPTTASGSGVSRPDAPAPAIATGAGDRLLVRVSGSSALQAGYPSGHTGIAIVDATRELAAAWIEAPSAGAYPEALFPLLSSGFPAWTGVTLAVAPASGGASAPGRLLCFEPGAVGLVG